MSRHVCSQTTQRQPSTRPALALFPCKNFLCPLALKSPQNPQLVPGFGEMSKPLRLERKMMEPIFAKFVGKGQKVQRATLICVLVACVAIVCNIAVPN